MQGVKVYILHVYESLHKGTTFTILLCLYNFLLGGSITYTTYISYVLQVVVLLKTLHV